MSTKINVPALVALFVATVAVSGPAAAQYSGSRVFICPTCADYSDNYAASGFQSQPQLQRLKRKLPSDAYGSVGSASVGYRSVGVGPATAAAPRARPFETDPDPSIRFEMNRDDYDRRRNAGGG
jgi:hypothetical protein